MASIENIVKEKNKLIYEMDSKETKEFIMNLIRKYYFCYVNNNSDGMESCKDKLHKFLVIYSNDDELVNYVNYCIAINSNIIIKAILKKDGELLNPIETIDDDKFKSLNERMKESVEYFKALEDEMNAKV